MRNVMYASIALLCLSIALLVGVQIGQRTATAADSPDVVKASAFVLEDAKGRERGRFAVRDDGAVEVALYDARERGCALFRVEDDGLAMLSLSGEGGACGKVGLVSSCTSGNGLAIGDSKEQGRLGVGLSGDGVSYLSLMDAGERTRFDVRVNSKGMLSKREEK